MKIRTLLALILFPLLSYAQFGGGVGDGFDHNQTYESSLNGGERCSDDFYEPNTILQLAQQIPNTMFSVYANLCPNQDEDWFFLQLHPQQTSLNLVLHNLSENYDISLHKGNMDIVAESHNLHSIPDTIAESNLSPNGRYFIRIYSPDSLFDQDYTLTYTPPEDSTTTPIGEEIFGVPIYVTQPNANTLTIHYSPTVPTPTTIQLYSMIGQNIQTHTHIFSPNSYKMSIPLPRQRSPLHFIHLQTPSNTYMMRILTMLPR